MPAPSSFIAEGLHGIRLGVVALFGIVVPGFWFWATAVFYLAYMFGGHSLADVKSASQTGELFLGSYWLWTGVCVVVYVTGSVLRILPPDKPDSWSLWKVKSRDVEFRIEWPDRFPYKSLPAYLRNRGLHGLAALVPWDTGASGDRQISGMRSKTFLHFMKLYIALHNPALANHLARQEAFIRLLSGVFYAVLLSTPIFALGLVAQRTWNELATVSAGVLVFNWLIVYGILHAFHYQRLRELVMMLSAYFLVGPTEKSPYIESERQRERRG
jgi:hypothetical protein